jgi:hypothetical protein
LVPYKTKEKKNIVMLPSAVKSPLKTNLTNLFLKEVKTQNSELAEKLKKVNPRDFCNLILKVFCGEYKTAYGLSLDKKNLNKNNASLLTEKL